MNILISLHKYSDFLRFTLRDDRKRFIANETLIVIAAPPIRIIFLPNHRNALVMINNISELVDCEEVELDKLLTTPNAFSDEDPSDSTSRTSHKPDITLDNDSSDCLLLIENLYRQHER